MSLIAHKNHVLYGGSVSITTGTVSVDLDNLLTMQTPSPYTEITPNGGAIEFSWVPDSSVDASTFALMGHTLPDGADISFSAGGASLSSESWSATDGRPNNHYVALDSDESFSTLDVSITSAGSDPVRIAGLWLGKALKPSIGLILSGFTPDSLSDVTRASATAWTNERASRERVPVRLSLTKDEFRQWRAIARSTGNHAPLIYIPDESQMSDSVYGTVDSFGPIDPISNHLWEASFDLMEMPSDS